MKSIFSIFLAMAAFALIAATPAEEAMRQCRSVHLTHEGLNYPATLLSVEVIPEATSAGTYFCLVGFNGGFCGIQELANGKHSLLFSVWDPGVPFNFSAHPDEDPVAPRTKILYGGENVELSRFGEGNGAKSVMQLDWELNKPVRLAVSAMAFGDHRTAYTCWLWKPEVKAWFRVATFATLASGPKGRFNACYSYIEDFLRNGESRHHVRKACFSRAWAYEGKTWTCSQRALFSGDRNLSQNIDAGPNGAGYWLQTGGSTVNSSAPLWSKITPEMPAERPEALDILLTTLQEMTL